MEFLVFIVCFFILLVFVTRNKNPINWNVLYLDKVKYSQIKYFIEQYISSCKEIIETPSKDFHDPIPVYVDINYKKYSFKELVTKLKENYSEEEISKYFTESELIHSHSKYKIDSYNETLEKYKSLLLNEKAQTNFQCLQRKLVSTRNYYA